MATHHDELNEFDALEDEIRDMLRTIGLRPQDLTLSADERVRTGAAAERALARIVAPAPAPVKQRAARRKRRLAVRVVGVVGLAAAVVIAVGLVRPGGGDSAAAQTPAMLHFQDVKQGRLLPARQNRGAAAQARTRRFFQSLAVAAARQPEPAPGPIQRVVVEGWWSSIEDGDGTKERPGGSVLIPTHAESYYLPDGRMRTVTHRGTPLDDDGRISKKVGTWLDTPTQSDEMFDASDPGPGRAQALSTEPEQLAKQLLADSSAKCETNRGWCLLSEINQLHHTYVISPTLRAAMWRTLADEPSITVLGSTRDRLGRKAVAFTVDSWDPHYQLVSLADPDTGAWLGDESILIKPLKGLDYTPPAVVELTALVEAERVDDDELPPGKPVVFG